MARFELRLPSGWEYKACWLNHAEVEPRSAASNRWVWELADLPSVEREPQMPHWQGVAGWLGVTYYGRGTTSGQQNQSSWRDIGLWYGKLAADRCKASAAIRQKVIELTTNVSKPLDQIRVLAAFVQKEIRYVAIEVGIGGYQPHSAEDVYTNRYGDCKDKATLLRTMLAEIGVDSYYVLINSHRGVVSPNFSSALGFNHVILAIRLPAETRADGLFSVKRDAQRGTLLYFDPTDTLVALGTLPESLQMSFGLLISEAGGELEQLPLAAPALNKLMRSAKLELSPSGAVQGAVTEIRWGAPANELRARLLNASASDRNKLFETFLGSLVSSSVLTGSRVENLEDPSSSLVIRYSFEATGYAKSAGDLLLIRPGMLGQKGDDIFEPKPGEQRKYPVEFPYTSLQSELVEIALPGGYVTDELPAAADISMPFGEYHSRCEVTGNTLRYTRRYQINALRVPVEQWQALQSFHSRIAVDERMNAVLKQVK
jgi:predicted transglutaminase-like cysteine proteinase